MRALVASATPWAPTAAVQDDASALTSEIEARVAVAYGWDSLDKPLVR